MATEDNPSRNEDEYFAKLDAELLKAKRTQLDVDRAKAERAQHLMKCPRDGTELQERDLQKVKIVVCPKCKGVWLDAGELEMLSLVDKNPVRRVFDDLLKGLR